MTLAWDPPALFAWLARQPRRPGLCVECGAGHGEVAAFMGGHFARAIATDIAPPPGPSPFGVRVIAALAEQIPCDRGSVDLVVSMQALHHFDIPAHLAEARRVLAPGGIFAALSWGEIVLPDTIAAAYRPVLGQLSSWWEAGRDQAVSGYQDLRFPGQPIRLPRARLRRRMTLRELDAEIAGWSASRAAKRAGAPVALPSRPDSGRARASRFEVAWPLIGQAFRVRD